jgi:hypothetical protein
LIKNLEGILNSLEEDLKEKKDDTYEDEDSRMYYQEVPKTEIAVLKELLAYYQE